MGGIPALVFYILAVSVSCIHGKSTSDTSESKIVKPEGRIIGGQDAIPNEFPHQIHLLQFNGNRTTLCGASLISNEWILTAAHCASLKPGWTWQITAGKHSGASIPGGGPGEQVSSANEIFIHPCYMMSPDVLFNNDIALFKLSKPFALNDRVNIIQLDEMDRAKPCNETTALGWGRIHPNNTDDLAPVLKKATLKLPAAIICILAVGGIHEQSQQCVKEMDSSVCPGDSGAPLLCKDDGANYLCGIASFVQNGSRGIGRFNIFVRVFYYVNWIKEVMGSGNNSRTGCVRNVPVRPLIPRPPSTLPTCEKKNNTNDGGMNKNTTEGVNNNGSTDSTGASTMQGQPRHGFYFRMILTSLLFTY